METDGLRLLRSMLRIRRLEEAVLRLAQQPSSPIRSHIHVYIGQEAAAVGACASLQPADYVFTTHRNHGHVLARGGEPGRILAEILGRVDGYCQGRGGSFHVAAPHLGILHTSAIVGGCLPLAAGTALAAQYQHDHRIALVFFGDGAMEEGVASETLNMAQAWRLPVVFLMENNGEQSWLAAVPRAYGIPTESVDGTDLEAVQATASRAIEQARGGGGPHFVESRTPRWPGGFETDIRWATAPEAAPESIRDWVARHDPVLRAARQLIDRGELAPDQLGTLDRQVQQEIQAAVDFALRSPEPDPQHLLSGVA